MATQPLNLTHAWQWLCPSLNSCGIRTPRRLIPTRRRGGAWCSRGVVTPPALRDLVWWPRGGEVLLARVSRCCRETAIPPCTPSLGNDPRRSFAPSSRPRCDDGSTHDRSRLAPARIAIPSRRNFGRCQCRRVMAPVWGGTSRRCGSMLARRWRPSEHRRFLALIPRGDPHVPSDWRRDDAVTGGPRATDRDASPDEFWSGGGASRRLTARAGGCWQTCE